MSRVNKIESTAHSISSFFTKPKVKKAIILAGGQGTEFDPITNCPPAYMLPVLNKPLIEHIIDFLKENGIDDVMVALSSKNEAGNKLESKVFNVLSYVEDRPRGTAGILKDVEGFIGQEPFFVINSNLFFGDIDLSMFVKAHMDTGAVATVGVYREHSNGIKETVAVESDGTIKGFYRIHPSIDRRSPWRPAGIFIFEPSILASIDQEKYMDIKEQLIPVLQKKGHKVLMSEIQGSPICLNTMKDYINLNRNLLLKSNCKEQIEGKEEIAECVWVGKNVEISPYAYLLGPVIIGDDCKVEDWSQIVGPAVIGNGCRISQGVFIRESILWNRVALSDGAKIEYSIVGEGYNVPNKFNIKNMILSNGLKIDDVDLISSDNGTKSTGDLTDIISIGATTRKIYELTKRLMDVTFSAVGLILMLPLFLLIAIAIKTDSKGPVFYIQKRCGKNGKLLGMIKFRTMVTNAEALHKDLLSKNESDGPMFKLTKDPRITRLGRILRSTSIDELPQLLNVFKGDMSLVGPRPLIMDEMRFSPSWRDTRLKVKPGITGLWQVQGRSEAPFHYWIKYDIYYVNKRSLWLDIKILLKTVKVVLQKMGAY